MAGVPARVIPMRGRGRERGVLDRMREDAKNGQSAALVVVGEAGVGKTVLLRYIADRAANDCQVAEVAGVESEMELAYAGLHQLCSPLLGQLDSLPAPQRDALAVAFGLSVGKPPDRFIVGLATLSLLAQVSDPRPLVCVVDDAQWLDEASAQVLGFVARRLAAESIVMIFAVRGYGEDGPLSGLPEMRVGGVPAEAARALLTTVVTGRLDDRVRDRIIAETGGNPLALLELPRGMSPAELAGGFSLPIVGDVPAQIEDRYLKRVRHLPEDTQRLMLLAAADTVGDAAVVWSAARRLGIGVEAAAPAAADHLLEFGARVRFRHPLVRSAVYHSALAEDRRAAHRALAEAIDPAIDPDRRAWHRANAACGPDASVADELEQCAVRSQARGGLAASAALLERAASLTPDATVRVERQLSAARFNLQAGDFGAASTLLAAADAETTDEFAHARVELLRGLVGAASKGGSEAPVQLLRAAQRLEPLDATLARQTYLDAWGAALFAGHLASAGGNVVDVSRAATAAPRPPDPDDPFNVLLDGLSTLVTDGRAASAPIIKQALQSLLTTDVSDEDWLHWGVLASSAAVTVWDFESWAKTSTRQVELARQFGALAMLCVALNGQAMISAWRGDFDDAAALVAEDEAIKQATGSQIAPYGAMLVAAYQARTAEASALIASTIEDSVLRGEGLGVDLARWTASILNNGMARYREALAMATPASNDVPGLYIATWMLPERVEAAVRCGMPEVAEAALAALHESASAGDSEWGLGIEARCRAMLSNGEEAELLYRTAIDHLSRTPIRTELARAHLVFGEWLRRENRRIDAREQLRIAHDMFVDMAADGFAERARRELAVAGEQVSKRRDESPTELTTQEEHIARLARDGATNAEIAAELFISARTVEWHLRKVFAKLGISSRRGLAEALPSRERSIAIPS